MSKLIPLNGLYIIYFLFVLIRLSNLRYRALTNEDSKWQDQAFVTPQIFVMNIFYDIYHIYQESDNASISTNPLLLTWFNFHISMDK